MTKQPTPTPQQRDAIRARGNVLVSAGAGAGKTRTLVERCLAWILDENERGSVDEILMVTFTEAAATEMRQRLRAGLEAAFDTSPSLRLQEQLALVETAHVSTLHSFCFYLVSQHFSEAGLDAPPSVLSNERARLLAGDAMDSLLEKVYDQKIAGSEQMQDLIRSLGGDWDRPTRDIIRRAHDYRHSLPNPDDWLGTQRTRYASENASDWQLWLDQGLSEWRLQWETSLEARADANEVAAKCAAILATLGAQPSRAEWASALGLLGKIEAPPRQTKLKDALKEFFKEAEFLRSVCEGEKGGPVEEDWSWARPPMRALLDLTEAYGRTYTAVKRSAGGLDFQDLEQLALRLLWDNGRPSPVALQWRKKFRLIFVDEYQDINGAQEAIIHALAREGSEANRFLVGDVKQSIYRFRLANPSIFRRQRELWEKQGGAAHYLTENFRSHEGILRFVNGLFNALMRPEMGGANYDNSQRLVFGDRPGRPHMAAAPEEEPRVELHLRRPTRRSDPEEETLSDTEDEARIIGQRLRELKNSGAIIHDLQAPRPVTWADMAILLRAPRHKAESYLKIFARLDIPLVAARMGFYDTLEARDLLDLLRILDNPLQDIPLLGVLRSPFGGFTPRDLAQIRIGREKIRFWTSLVSWKPAKKDEGLAWKVNTFLTRFKTWRRRARQESVASTLERALDETQYSAWLGAVARPEQRRSNVERFLELARDYDAERGEGLYRFLKLVEAQQENSIDLEPGAAPASDAVRLMSIHQSKGLEFPVVALGGLGTVFNYVDTYARVILDERSGLCPQIRAPGSAQFYPSVAHWLARRRQKRETQSEEMRLLYVAATRAMERLILVGTVAEQRMRDAWPDLAAAVSGPEGAARGNSFLDWIGAWINGPHESNAAPKVVMHAADEALTDAISSPSPAPADDISPETRARMDWKYPFPEAATQPAKTSVSALRREFAALDTEESARWLAPSWQEDLDAAEIGSAHHKFLECASLPALANPEGVAAEAARLCQQGRLTTKQTAALNLPALAAFWQSEAGRAMLSQKEFIRRELAFTARFGAAELAEKSLAHLGQPNPGGDGEWIVVQGAVDLAAILPNEIWIVDFKTDRFAPVDLAKKIDSYRPQLKLYAAALKRVYRRPVTRLWLCFLRQGEVALL